VHPVRFYCANFREMFSLILTEYIKQKDKVKAEEGKVEVSETCSRIRIRDGAWFIRLVVIQLFPF